MKHTELVVIESSYKLDLNRETKQPVYWLVLTTSNKKVSSRYGPFLSVSETKLYALEHHINLTSETVGV